MNMGGHEAVIDSHGFFRRSCGSFCCARNEGLGLDLKDLARIVSSGVVLDPDGDFHDTKCQVIFHVALPVISTGISPAFSLMEYQVCFQDPVFSGYSYASAWPDVTHLKASLAEEKLELLHFP
jgi:hypothetical protein